MRLLVATLVCLLVAAPIAAAYPAIPNPPFSNTAPPQPPGFSCDPTDPACILTSGGPVCSITDPVGCITAHLANLGLNCPAPPVPLVPFILSCTLGGGSVFAFFDPISNTFWLTANADDLALWAANYVLCDIILGPMPPVC